MKADQYSMIDSVKVKARADYKCQKCGSDEIIQAHAPNRDHTDWRKGIALCGNCHANEHPNVPRSLFLLKVYQPYWHNISARALATECSCHSRTVIRWSKRLGIASNCILSSSDKELIKSSISTPNPSFTSERGHLRCPLCGSLNTYSRKDGSRRCQHCGHTWKVK